MEERRSPPRERLALTNARGTCRASEPWTSFEERATTCAPDVIRRTGEVGLEASGVHAALRKRRTSRLIRSARGSRSFHVGPMRPAKEQPMTKTRKPSGTRSEPKLQTLNAAAALTEAQLQAARGAGPSLFTYCATGSHFPEVVVTR
jgi:hypothetical protein